MSVIDVPFIEETKTRYLTYALSVVSGRALPDVRDGLKPVQRRILYAMLHNLHLNPEKQHRKSAAVVGEVLARYHPHGDVACYDAMVRMAQDFSLRYPLVDGQGNFGSLDGDEAAAYRYTEARLTKFALEVIGDIGEETVPQRDNFDQTTKEPVVFPSRVPNLLINGAAGIAVGMATSIPPHNLTELIKSLLLLLSDDDVSDTKLYNLIKGPDFPTGCAILNSRDELKEIYKTGRGSIRMRAEYTVETLKRDRKQLVITAIPYGIDKSALIEKIADFIIAKKIPQLLDVRDESTNIVRIVLELAPDADAEAAIAFLFKQTSLQTNFNVNLTALVPTENPFTGRPLLLSLRDMLMHFVKFRISVTRAKLLFERGLLEERIHLLEGLMKIIDAIAEVIRIIRKSEGRSDAATKLQKRFELTEIQAFFVVDLRLHQLSETSVGEIDGELKEKADRVKAINQLLASEKALRGVVAEDLQRILKEHGDERRCRIENDYTEPTFDAESYVKHEEVHVIVTKDGWLKRIGANNDASKTKVRPQDKLFFVRKSSTKDLLSLFTNFGNVFVCKIIDVSSTSGFGEPVQKMFRFQDGEQIVDCCLLKSDSGEAKKVEQEVFLYSRDGYGFRYPMSELSETKRTGKRLVRLGENDVLSGVITIEKKYLFSVSTQGYGVIFPISEVPVLTGAGKGVIIQKLPDDDAMASACSVSGSEKLTLELHGGAVREISLSELTPTGRAKRGLKVIKRGGPVVRVIQEVISEKV